MTKEQTEWMDAHPTYKSWRPEGAVVLTWWADLGYLTPQGAMLPYSDDHKWFGDAHLMSVADTLYVVPKGSMKIGREVPAV